MGAISIGKAAAKLGMKASALRYYEDRKLVRPGRRRGGQRFYDDEELRRLAFVQMLSRVGVDLEVAAAVLEEPSVAWRARVQDEIAVLDARIAEATMARAALCHVLECPAAHPVRECGTMRELLDRRVSGASLGEIAEQHGLPKVGAETKPTRGRSAFTKLGR